MKLFGEFLVQKGVITEELLLQAVVRQIAMLPATAEIILAHKILPPSQLLAVLKHQSQWRIDFIASAQALGVWSEEVASRLQKELAEVRVPLGMILINMGALEADQLPHYLDEYFAERAKGTLAISQPNQPLALSHLVWESLRSWNWKDLENSLHGALAELLMGFDSSEPRFRLRELISEYSGLARLAGVSILVELSTEIHRQLSQSQVDWNQQSKKDGFADLLSESIVFLTDALGELIQAQSSANLFFPSDKATTAMSLMKQLKSVSSHQRVA